MAAFAVAGSAPSAGHPSVPVFEPAPRAVAVLPAGLLAGAGPAAPAAAAALVAFAASSAGRRRRGRAALKAAVDGAAGRRAAVLGALGAAWLTKPRPSVAAEEKLSSAALSEVQAALAKLVRDDPNKGPTLVRLAWHSSGTYDKMSKTGGSFQGTIRFQEELAHGGNAGLDKAVAWLEPIKTANPTISYADLYTLSGVVAIKTLGGPDVPWKAGRVDSMDPKDVTPDGRLPNADNGSYKKDVEHIKDVFYRMGFNDKDIVALSGAHALGRCHADASGFVGPWTPTPTRFNNLYYTLLMNLDWEEGCPDGETCKNHQYVEKGSRKLMMLPTDIALLKDPLFKRYVEMYAKDEKVFFADFSKAFSTLLELGTTSLYVVA